MTGDSARFFEDACRDQVAMAIFRGRSPEETVRLCHRAWDAGLALVEVPVQTPDALPSLRAAVAAGRERGRVVGAGTVTTAEQVGQVRRSGAAFTVAPGLHPEVVDESERCGLPHLPGVATASEIAAAVRLGHTWLKAFPAAQLTPGWIAAQLAPFPQVRFVATGGIDAANAELFLAAGARLVAVGSAVSDEAQLARLAALSHAGR
jgi:2-dehydro-3-deoxyphosphogluconate aldolase/(4S)-4-hydroxy-2-oxoglutarate aldolase